MPVPEPEAVDQYRTRARNIDNIRYFAIDPPNQYCSTHRRCRKVKTDRRNTHNCFRISTIFPARNQLLTLTYLLMHNLSILEQLQELILPFFFIETWLYSSSRIKIAVLHTDFFIRVGKETRGSYN